MSCSNFPRLIQGIILMIISSTLSCYGNFKTFSGNASHKVDSVLEGLPGIDWDYITAIQGVKHQLPLVGYFFKNIHEMPNFSEAVSKSTVGSRNNLQALFYSSYQLLGAGAGGFGPPLQGAGQSKTIRNQEELIRFFEQSSVELVQEQEWEKLPYSLKKAVVEILFTIDEAKIVFEQFAKPVKEYLNTTSAFSAVERYEALIIPWDQRELTNFSPVELINDVDLKLLSFATRKLAVGLNRFVMQNEFQIPEDFTSCTIKTHMGDLLINGIKKDTIEEGPFFILELGGDDVYRGNTACPGSADQPFGVVVDLGGNDKYLSGDHFLVAGIMGIAILLDLEGDDVYQTSKPGLAFSLYGSSLLYDYSGDDNYFGKEHTQAAVYIGASILADIYGDDSYNCGSMAQGFGGTLGVGIMFDNRGNDHYNTTSADGKGNDFSQSFIQGAARGRWAEATDGQSLAGGIGVFIDNSGVDHYAAGSFSQGASYYFGFGLFNDNEGDDEYNAVSHSQGYAAHYSLGGFFEQKGNDSYNARSNKEKLTQIIGGGRDFSVGLFIDFDGDDAYHFGNRSAGIGDIKGVGMLADINGNDKYFWHKNAVNQDAPSLGKEPGLEKNMGIGSMLYQPIDAVHKGFFIDSKGENTFE